MRLINDKVILRDFIESDIDDRIRWETIETEWHLWDAPWEHGENCEPFNSDNYRQEMNKKLQVYKDELSRRWSFQICINNNVETHIGWCNVYSIDDDYNYTSDIGHSTIGIDIPCMSARKKGYATAAWTLLIEYLFSQGDKDIYTQTWSGNTRLIGLANKLGFKECNRKSNSVTVRGNLYDSITFKLNKTEYYNNKGGTKMDLMFKNIDKSNFLKCISLSVTTPQEEFVASNCYSLAESSYGTGEHYPLAIYDDETMIGFIMYSYFNGDKIYPIDSWWLCRFMIDKKYQHQGYGKASLLKLINYMKNKYGISELRTSAESENSVALKLYEEVGFVKTGEIVEGEVVLLLKL